MDNRRLIPSRILSDIIYENRIWELDKYTFIIMGRPGPTGKTTLCNQLRERGFNAIELSQSIYDLVEYNYSGNFVRKDDENKLYIIVLNNKV